MMVKKGITAKSLEESRTKMANQDQDLVKCPHCGRFFSRKSAADNEGKCTHCGN